MTPLSKKILLFSLSVFSLAFLAFSFQLIAPSPSLAVTNANGCTAQDDCKDPLFPFCHCDPTLGADTQNHCLPDSDGDPGGVCTSAQQCTPSTAGRDCGDNKICITTKDGNFCAKSENEPVILAAPYFIRTPEDITAAANDVNGVYDSDKFKLETMSGLASTMIVALGGGETNVLGASTQSNSGATGILTGLVLNMTTKPVISSKEYLADLGQNLGIVPVSPAYAQSQGIGFNAFSPVLILWKIFRDIAYLTFVAIFIVVGLMVMFRKKIDPRTVITIQDSLPRIIVALLLVTFSYAIAGLIVDLGEFTTRLVGNLFTQNGLIALGKSDAIKQQKLDNLLSANVFQLVNPLRMTDDLVRDISEVNIGATNLPFGLSDITVRLVFMIAGFFVMFKIFFALVSPYVSIMLSVIFAPIQLAIAAIPGSNDSVMGWLRNLIANIAVFPVTFIMLSLSAIFKNVPCGAPQRWFGGSADWCTAANNYTTLWSPPVIGNWGAVAGQLIGFAILFTIPNVVDMVKSSLQIKDQPWAGAAGKAIAEGAARVPIVGGMLGGMVK